MMNVQQPQGGAANVAPFHSASLYVGDLAPDVAEAVLFDIFNQVGPVASIRVCRDTVTRRSLGYAYVNFHNVADAERALDTMNFTMIKTRPCRIMWSQRDPSLRRSGVGNIFVKNLDTTVDNKALYDTFSLFGNILSCKVATDEHGNSKGYGYVHYETAEAANEAIANIDGLLIANKQVHVGHFVRRNERAGQADWTNVYVKNLPAEWSEEKLREEFAKFGAITSCKLQLSPPPGEPPEAAATEGEGTAKAASSKAKGFGFVNFEEHEGAVKAVEHFNGLKLGEGEDMTELFASRAQKKVERQRELTQKYELLKVERMNRYQGVNLYVKNLDEEVTEDALREAFAPYGTITSARVMKDSSGGAAAAGGVAAPAALPGQSKGFGFVCFSAPEEATKAVQEMNNKMLANKPIYVALAQRKEVRRAQLEAQYSQRTSGMAPRGLPGMPQGPGMYGAMPYMMAAGPGMPGQRGGMTAQPPYPMMPQQMMAGPRGAMAARGPMPGAYGGRGTYPMPAYAAMAPVPGMGAAAPRRGGGNPGGAGSGVGGAGGVPAGGPGGVPGQPGGPRQRQGQPGGPQGQPVVPTARQQQQAAQQQQQAAAAAAAAQQQGAPRGKAPAGRAGFQYTQQVRNPSAPGVGGGAGAANAAAAAASMASQQQEALTPAALAAASPEKQKNMIGERLYPLIFDMQPELAGKITGMLLEMDNGELLHLLESPDALRGKIQEALQVLQQHQAQVTGGGGGQAGENSIMP